MSEAKKTILIAGATVAIGVAILAIQLEQPTVDVREISSADVKRELGNAEEMAKALTINPHFVADRMDGFELVTVAKGSIADRLGLSAGDVITSIGGRPLDTPESAFSIHDHVKSMREIDVTYQRDQRLHSVVVRIIEGPP